MECSQNGETESLIPRWQMEHWDTTKSMWYLLRACDICSFNTCNLRFYTRGQTASHQHLCLCVLPGNPYYDSLGSLGVGTLLGTVSAFLIYTNTEALLGRSIQAERVQKLTEFLENDPAVRSAEEQHTHTHPHLHSWNAQRLDCMMLLYPEPSMTWRPLTWGWVKCASKLKSILTAEW